jgi:predicted transcriptional regulator
VDIGAAYRFNRARKRGLKTAKSGVRESFALSRYAVSMPRPAIHYVTQPKAWATIIAPVRLEIIESLRMIAPCSIAELAAALDRPADALYRHIAKLERAGVVVSAGMRHTGRRSEQVYDLVADDLRVAFKDASQRTANKAYNDTVQSIVKIVSRTSRDASAAGQLAGSSDERVLIGKIEHSWLTHEEFQAVRAMMMGIKEFMDSRKGRREGRLYCAAFVALPVTRKRGASARTERKAASAKRTKQATRTGRQERAARSTRKSRADE